MLSDNSVQALSDSSQKQQAGRIGYIDLTKGLVLILVITSHTDVHWLTDPLEAFRLPLLFLCSGFTSRPDFNVGRRIGRFFRSYIILSVICLIYTLIVAPHSIGFSDTALGFVYNRYYIASPDQTLLNGYNSVLWFLGALIVATLLFHLLLRLPSFKAQLALAIIYLCVGLAFTGLPILLPHSIDTAFFFAPIIWVGFLMRQYGFLNRLSITHLLLLTAIYIASTYYLGITNISVRDFGSSYLLAVVSGLSGSVVFMKLCTYLDKIRPLNVVKTMNRQGVYVFGMQLIFISLTQIIMQTYVTDNAKIIIPLQILAACVGGYLTGRIIDWSKRKCHTVLSRST